MRGEGCKGRIPLQRSIVGQSLEMRVGNSAWNGQTDADEQTISDGRKYNRLDNRGFFGYRRGVGESLVSERGYSDIVFTQGG